MSTLRDVVVLAEGPSDVAAIGVVLDRAGLTDGISVVAMGGATNIRTALAAAVAREPAPRVLGLCDEGEADYLVRAITDAGAPVDAPAGLAELGFHTCRRDLEDELVRALGPEAVVDVLEGLGLAASFDRFRHQPAWRGRDLAASLVRFAGAGSGRKERLARAVAAELALDRLPAPLVGLL